MIDLWTVRYTSPEGVRETFTVYAYPSGGVGVSTSDPALTEILGPVHTLCRTDRQDDASDVAGRVADMVCHLTGGETEYHQIYGSTEAPV